MVNISTTVRGHYGNDVYLWAIIIRRFCDTREALRGVIVLAEGRRAGGQHRWL
jgi:RNA binding exosome subunit